MIYAVLILSVLAGALAVLKFKLSEPRRIKLVTAFTGAYLISLTFLHMVPEVFAPHDHDADAGHAHHEPANAGVHDHEEHHHHTPPTGLILGAFVLAGFFLQIIAVG